MWKETQKVRAKWVIPCLARLDIKQKVDPRPFCTRLESEGSENQAEEAGAGGTKLDVGIGGVAGLGRASLCSTSAGAGDSARGIGGWKMLASGISSM